ncbi:helix-turn-helix transcriptional regulator [Virgibacillus halodenitrificans]|uniref:helix-turn-helix transcriptional regulator n=1 Tax=Virgibacillus halodenitrificans TaxID=1482 RepID=UPI0013CECD23|nr:HTH domain-containing protein [Virgibacillus halodenitrificans]
MRQNRQLEILLYLLKTKKTTNAELAALFEVSIKTIQRDIDDLSAMGVPITSKQGNQGGIYIEKNYKLSQSFLNNNDLYHIALALYAFDNISSVEHREDIMKKLALVLPDLIHLFENDLNDYFVMDIFEEKVGMDEPIYEAINYCFDEELCLSVSFDNKEMTVAPISYVLRSDGLYLYAYSMGYELIKITSIYSYRITEKQFERSFIPYKQNIELNSNKT